MQRLRIRSSFRTRSTIGFGLAGSPVFQCFNFSSRAHNYFFGVTAVYTMPFDLVLLVLLTTRVTCVHQANQRPSLGSVIVIRWTICQWERHAARNSRYLGEQRDAKPCWTGMRGRWYGDHGGAVAPPYSTLGHTRHWHRSSRKRLRQTPAANSDTRESSMPTQRFSIARGNSRFERQNL